MVTHRILHKSSNPCSMTQSMRYYACVHCAVVSAECHVVTIMQGRKIHVQPYM